MKSAKAANRICLRPIRSLSVPQHTMPTEKAPLPVPSGRLTIPWLVPRTLKSLSIQARGSRPRAAVDLQPEYCSDLSWSFPFMIPRAGEGEFDVAEQAHGHTDRLCTEAGGERPFGRGRLPEGQDR